MRAGRGGGAQPGTTTDPSAAPDGERTKRQVCDPPGPAAHADRQTARASCPGEHDAPRARRAHRLAGSRRKVDAAVASGRERRAGGVVERPTDRSWHRPLPAGRHDRRGRGRERCGSPERCGGRERTARGEREHERDGACASTWAHPSACAGAGAAKREQRAGGGAPDQEKGAGARSDRRNARDTERRHVAKATAAGGGSVWLSQSFSRSVLDLSRSARKTAHMSRSEGLTQGGTRSAPHRCASRPTQRASRRPAPIATAKPAIARPATNLGSPAIARPATNPGSPAIARAATNPGSPEPATALRQPPRPRSEPANNPRQRAPAPMLPAHVLSRARLSAGSLGRPARLGATAPNRRRRITTAHAARCLAQPHPPRKRLAG